MYDNAHCLNRYREMMRDQPALFMNPPGCPTQIITDPGEIAKVQNAVHAKRQKEGYDTRDLRVGVLAEDQYIGAVIRDAVLFSDGEPGLYNRVVATGGIAALPILDDQIVLIRIFRHAVRRWFLEAPQGLLPVGSDAADEVRRELQEEMGAEVTELVALGQVYTSTALTSERLTMFAARISGTGRPQRSEGIESVERIPMADIDKLIVDGTICDGPSIALITQARLRDLL